MKNIALVLIVLFAIVGMASAAGRQPTLTIYSPEDGETYGINTEIELDMEYRGSGNEQIYSRVLVDGQPHLSATLTFEVPGEHTITVEVAKNPEYMNPISKSVTIKVA